MSAAECAICPPGACPGPECPGHLHPTTPEGTHPVNSYQILLAGERYATTADWAECITSAPALTALGVGTTYAIHALSEPAEDGALRWMVTYKPTGPASLRAVVVADSVSLTEAFDLVRDAVAEQLADEGCSL